MVEAGSYRCQRMVEGRGNLHMPQSDTSVTKRFSAKSTRLWNHKKKNDLLTRALGARPHLEPLGHQGLGLFQWPL